MGKTSVIVNLILEGLTESAKAVPLPFETPYQHIRRMRRISYGYKTYSRSIRQLSRRGALKVTSKAGKKFLQITKKGELQLLLEKAKLSRNLKLWDGKWRLVVFDIPESAKEKRFIFRALLKRNGFFKLQASVYISPYPLNREAIVFLQKSRLISYIRIMRIDEMDREVDLRKHFKV